MTGKSMNIEEIRELETRANLLYQSGEYEQARELWGRILELDPENQKAAEGVRMAALLTDNWDVFAQEGGEEKVTVESGLDCVNRLSSAGQYCEALAGLQQLQHDYPDNEAVQQARQDVERAFEMAPFVLEQMATARRMMEEGRPAEAEAACRKVLALDPTHRDARLLVEELEFTHPRDAAPPAPASPPEAATPGKPISPPEPVMETTPPEPTPPEVSHPPREDTPPASEDELPVIDLLEVADDPEEEAVPSSGAPLLEEPEESSKHAAAEESNAVVSEPSVTADTGVTPADLPAGEPVPWPDPPDPGPQREETEAAPADFDLTWEEPEATPAESGFMQEKAGSAPADSGIVPEESDTGQTDPQATVERNARDTAHLGALVEEGHRHLDENRYQEAINCLSRALAQDEGHEGAARLLEQARRGLQESQQLAEVKLLEGIDLLEAGLLDEAESQFQQVLAAIPDHAGAMEYLEAVAERRRQEDNPASPVDGPAADGVDASAQVPGAGSIEGPHSPDTGPADLSGIEPGRRDFGDESADAVPLAVTTGTPGTTGDVHRGPVPGVTSSVEPHPRRVSRGRRLRVLGLAAVLIAGAGTGVWYFRDSLLPGLGRGEGEEMLTPTVLDQLGSPGTPGTDAVNQSAAGPSDAASPTSGASNPAGGEGAGVAAQAPADPVPKEISQLLAQARGSVRHGRGKEALATLALAWDLQDDPPGAMEVRQAAQWVVTAHESFNAGDYASSLRAQYRLAVKVDSSLRPDRVDRWLDNTRWNFLLSELREGRPWRVLELVHPTKGALQLWGREREVVQPLIAIAERWQFEDASSLDGPGYRAEVEALELRSIDD